MECRASLILPTQLPHVSGLTLYFMVFSSAEAGGSAGQPIASGLPHGKVEHWTNVLTLP